jgi:hypothetical protein
LKQLKIYIILIPLFFYLLFASCVKESQYNLAVDTLKLSSHYQPNEIFGKDAIIESLNPNQNSGDSIQFTVFSWTNGGQFNHARALIQFDLSSIPPETQIESAKLSLYWVSHQNLNYQTGENAFSIYKITQPWNENSVNWNNQPQFTTTNKVSVSKSISSTQSYIDIDVTVLVKDMINYPNESYGFMLKLDEEFPYKLVILASSDYPEAAKRPKLVVYY